MSPTSAIVFIKGRNLQHMRNNIRYNGNTNNTSVIVFFNRKSKITSHGTLLRRTSEEVFLVVVLHFILSFHFWSSFCCCSEFIAFRRHPSPFRGLSPSFYTHFILLAQPIAEWFATLSFWTFPISSYCERYGSEGVFFTHSRFLPYASSSTFLAQPAFIKASLGAGSPSLKSAGLHTDPRNTDPPHLFVWIAVIHNLYIQNFSILNFTIYYHELLVVKSLVYMPLTRFELFSLVQSHM